MAGDQVYKETLEETITRLKPQFDQELQQAVEKSDSTTDFTRRLILMAALFTHGSPGNPLARSIYISKREERGLQEFTISTNYCWLKIPNGARFTLLELLTFSDGAPRSFDGLQIYYLLEEVFRHLKGDGIDNPPHIDLT